MFLSIVAVFAALIAIAVVHIKHAQKYWSRRNVAQLDPKLLRGNTSPNTNHSAIFTAQNYDLFKKQGVRYGGLYAFTLPILLPVALDFVKTIMAKDFQHFHDRGFNVSDDDESLDANIFRVSGNRWRTLRTKLSPTFTSGKIKGMFETLKNCLEPMTERLERLSQTDGSPVDIKDMVGCFTTDVIGSCAFGIECNSFAAEESPFRTNGKKIFTPVRFRKFKRLVGLLFPKLAKLFKINDNLLPEVAQFFQTVVRQSVELREQKQYQRQDFMQLLVDLKKQEILNMNEIAAQSFVFFLAGFETSSTATTFTMYLLAKHHKIQAKVREEITKVLGRYNGEITYEAMQEMKYLEQVVEESLRLYPPIPQIPRRCTEDYKVPNEHVVIEKGTLVLIPIYGIHHNEEHYPDPETFDPDRFSAENKQSRHPYAFLPFGEGPRICMGLRFGMLQTKVALVGLLRQYKFTVNEKTEEPLMMNPDVQILTVKGDIWLNIHKL